MPDDPHALLEEAERLDAEATAAPWLTGRTQYPMVGNFWFDRHCEDGSCPVEGHGGPGALGTAIGVTYSPEDAQFIARARTLLPALASALRAAQAELRAAATGHAKPPRFVHPSNFSEGTLSASELAELSALADLDEARQGPEHYVPAFRLTNAERERDTALADVEAMRAVCDASRAAYEAYVYQRPSLIRSKRWTDLHAALRALDARATPPAVQWGVWCVNEAGWCPSFAEPFRGTELEARREVAHWISGERADVKPGTFMYEARPVESALDARGKGRTT